jgi:17beta-estradiol 17-dehydrogenase / very-long-chain 3-oxoacyl-CoA reductase
MYGVQTKTVAVDFTGNSEIYEKISKSIEGLEVGVLINNVGLSYANPEYYTDLPNNDKLISDIVTCNVVSITNMCKLILPGMCDRGKGVIINISSLSAVIPAPMLTVYAASKVNKLPAQRFVKK